MIMTGMEKALVLGNCTAGKMFNIKNGNWWMEMDTLYINNFPVILSREIKGFYEIAGGKSKGSRGGILMNVFIIKCKGGIK